ncbi:MAG: hypothetical protein AAGK25_06275, partial [Pseudomonadota bacterium]
MNTIKKLFPSRSITLEKPLVLATAALMLVACSGEQTEAPEIGSSTPATVSVDPSSQNDVALEKDELTFGFIKLTDM